MDRRTLLFVVTLSISLMLVNTFFEYRNRDALTERVQQEAAKKKREIQQLESFINEHSLTREDLPLFKIYSNEALSEPLHDGIAVDDKILTLSLSETPPQDVFAKADGKTEKFTLTSTPKGIGKPLLYGKTAGGSLRIASLPDFGRFDVVVVPLDTQDNNGLIGSVAEYTDGHLSIPALELAALQAKPGDNITEPNFDNGVVLYKTGDHYLPVGLYSAARKRLVSLKDFKEIPIDAIKTATKDVKSGSGSEKPAEMFYVLENDYQQLVFSNYGGAVSEINLPFQSESDEKSVVKEIGFDRNMVEDHPYNAVFPAHAYYTPGSDLNSMTEHDRGAEGGYYPLIRRDLIESKPGKSVKISPANYAFNVVSEYPELGESVYEVKYFDKNKIVFELAGDRRRITKTYTINNEDAPYVLDMTVKVEGDGRGLWLTSGVPEVELISGAFSPALKYRITRDNKSEVKLIDLPTENTVVTSSHPDWVCNSNGFFGIILDPLTEIDSGYRAEYIAGNLVPTRLVEVEQERERFNAKEFPGYQIKVPLRSKGGTMKFRVFAGPFSTPILKQVDSIYADASTGYNPDYIACQTFHGWFSFISEPFAKFLFLLMNFFHTITGSWAFSIVLLTIALRLMLYPLNAWSTKSMLKTQQIMPKIQAIQEKYKNDPKKAQVEIMNFYRDQGINPLSGITGGCFPLLIQMPFLIGMFDLLKSSFQLRGAPFIPGWIDDLSAPDVLFSWKTSLPLIGNQFHLLPIILGFIMFFQPRMMSPLPADKSEWSEQQRQQRAMGNIMAVMFTWLFYNFPSGLNIYWASSMLLGMLQQWWNKRNMKPEAQVEILPPKKGGARSR